MARQKRIHAEPAELVDPADEQQAAQAFDEFRAGEQAQALAVSQHDAAVKAVAAQIGYQLPADCTDPDLIQRDISANMRRSVEACLEVGRGLVALKEACQHGQFVARLDVLGLDRKVAAKFMQAARKFSNVSSTRHLLEAAGNQTKLFELLVLDDAEAEELALTGQTGELSLDDVATMSVKELRAKLREAKAENKAQAELLAEKNQRLDELRANQKRIATLPPDDVAAELMQETGKHSAEAAGVIQGTLRQAFVALAQHYVGHGGADPRDVMAGHVDQLQRLLVELRDDFNLPDHVGDGTPEWMRATADDADLAAAEA